MMFNLNRTAEATTVAEDSVFARSYPTDSFDYADGNNNPVNSMLCYYVGLMAESNAYQFSLSFNDIEVSFPVRSELTILLEQLPGLIAHLRAGISDSEHIVEFYEQGYEATITFKIHQSGVLCTLVSGQNAQQHSDLTNLDSLRSNISDIIMAFLNFSFLFPQHDFISRPRRDWVTSLLFSQM